MRTRWAALQLVGFVVAGLALLAPDPARLVRHWSAATIYPWWAALYVVLGALAGLAPLLLRDRARSLVAPTLSVVMAAQLAGLGLVAVKHWRPSFGMGGGYAGELEDLVRLAWVLAAAATVAGLGAVAQLVGARAFPLRTTARDAAPWLVVGALVLVLLPYGIAEGVAEQQDATSLGAFVLLYSAPLGLVVVGAAWLAPGLRPVAVASCAVAAGLSALDPITDLTHLHGRPALVATAVVLVVLAGATSAMRTSSRTGGYRENKNVF